jgi:hypothetical protein
MRRHAVLAAILSAAALAAPALGQATEAPTTEAPTADAPRLATFRNRSGTFQLDLPAHWRQLAPNEARTIGEDPDAPRLLRLSQPGRFYAVGDVDAWLRRDYTAPFAYVVEQPDEMYLDDDFAERLAEGWQRETVDSGVQHRLERIRREKIGAQGVEVVLAERHSRPVGGPGGPGGPGGGPPTWSSLDVQAPTGRHQIALSLVTTPDRFARWQPEFRRWIDTLVFAQVRREQSTLTDRLWTPLIVGGLVGLVLLVLYKHTRGRR